MANTYVVQSITTLPAAPGQTDQPVQIIGTVNGVAVVANTWASLMAPSSFPNVVSYENFLSKVMLAAVPPAAVLSSFAVPGTFTI